ncbi:piwi-like protein Ago3 [Portunus trituberculatus]|uniref:piwi-like protein Ago3 n=1 Tax=Portunus trituberculatus TaxID=210409 RepID=UPI001E1CED47|nr:piwi-like protein Ago3 [Portunus trituberculatus]
MEEDSTKKRTLGGRGALIMKALENKARQPQQATSSEPPQAVVPPLQSGARGVGGEAAALSPPNQGDGAPKPQTLSRGALLSQILQKRASFRGSPNSSADEMNIKPGIAQGSTALLTAEMVGSVTTQPGALPLQSSSAAMNPPLCKDEVAAAAESIQLLSVSETEQDPIKQHGTTGTKFSGTGNWIRLSQKEDKAVFQYEVKFEPQVDALNIRFGLLNTFKEQLGSAKTFDGNMLWLPIRLPKEIVLFETTNPQTNGKVTLKIIYKKKVKMDECIQFYNVLFNRIMRKLKMTKIGNNYYSPGGSVLVPQHKLEIWPGYVTSVSHQEDGLMICVDVSHRILRTETCYEVMSALCQKHRGNFKDAITSTLIGCVVLTRYNNRTYHIDDVLFDQNPTSSFTNYEGKEVKYVDYYQDTYGIKIKDLKQPLLCHKVRKKELKDQSYSKSLCLIPELCNMTGLTDALKADFHVMKDVAQHTRITPNVRHASLRSFIKNVNENEEAHKILADWGLSLQDNSLPFEGRICAPETIIFGSQEVAGSQLADWGRESSREKVIMPVDLMPRRWLVIFSPRDQECARNFCNMMRTVGRSIGIQVGEPLMVQLHDDRTESYVVTLKQQYHSQLQLAVLIFPTQREDRYSAVKRVACGDMGLPTQCIVSRTINQEKKLRAVTQKIVLQINCKLGGELWALKIPLNGLMVCGVDVYHDSCQRGSSVVGFVASMNQTLTKWYSNVSFQHTGDEIVHKLKIHLLESLRHYHKIHHALPRSIILYRDGVSEGQLKIVEGHEIPQLTTVFMHFDSYNPKLSYVVVQKRLNTRIFTVSRGLNNPPPGSIVDNTITSHHWYDFFLVSQHVRQGTVSPTHYIVVQDGSNLKVDHMQRLAYKMTHLYYNWPGTVRVPAPCLYAHKLAYLIGQNVKKDPAVGLCDKLFYL